MSTAVRELNAITLDEELSSSPVPVVVEFWAEWCPPCKAIAPILESIAVDYRDRVRVAKINSDEHPDLARRYDVASIPTILAFSDGELRHRMVGARSRSRLLEDLGDFIS